MTPQESSGAAPQIPQISPPNPDPQPSSKRKSQNSVFQPKIYTTTGLRRQPSSAQQQCTIHLQSKPKSVRHPAISRSRRRLQGLKNRPSTESEHIPHYNRTHVSTSPRAVHSRSNNTRPRASDRTKTKYACRLQCQTGRRGFFATVCWNPLAAELR